MKRAVLIVVSGLALVGLLIADIAWPKASDAEETPAAAPAAQAGATPEAPANSVPKPATAETSESVSQGTKAEEASAQNMPGSLEDALDQLNEESKEEAASHNNDAPATTESDAR